MEKFLKEILVGKRLRKPEKLFEKEINRSVDGELTMIPYVSALLPMNKIIETGISVKRKMVDLSRNK